MKIDLGEVLFIRRLGAPICYCKIDAKLCSKCSRFLLGSIREHLGTYKSFIINEFLRKENGTR